MKRTARPVVAPNTDVATITEDTIRSFAGYNIKRAFNVVQTDLNRTLKPFGLRMVTFTALALIVDNPGLRLSQLAQSLGIERPNLVVIVDDLEARDLITRDKVPQDRRAYALHATLAGRVLRDKSVAAVEEHEKRVYSAVTEAEIRALVQVLRKIESNG